MSLDYSLSLSIGSMPAQILERIVSRPGFSSKKTYVAGHGLFVSAGTKSELGIAISEKEYGFRPTCVVIFTLDLAVDLEPSCLEMIVIVIEFLSESDSDAVFGFSDSDTFLLLRRNGHLVLCNKYEFWRDDLLSLVTLDYEMMS